MLGFAPLAALPLSVSSNVSIISGSLLTNNAIIFIPICSFTEQTIGYFIKFAESNSVAQYSETNYYIRSELIIV